MTVMNTLAEQNKLDVNVKDIFGRTPLHHAVAIENKKTVKVLKNIL